MRISRRLFTLRNVKLSALVDAVLKDRLVGKSERVPPDIKGPCNRRTGDDAEQRDETWRLQRSIGNVYGPIVALPSLWPIARFPSLVLPLLTTTTVSSGAFREGLEYQYPFCPFSVASGSVRTTAAGLNSPRASKEGGNSPL